MKLRYDYNGICVEVFSSEDKYIKKVKTYIDTKQYALDLFQYCKVEKANDLQIRINENESISMTYQNGDICGGFTTFLVAIKG